MTAMSHAVFVTVAIISGALLSACESTFLTSDGTVESANEALIAGRVDEARKTYDKAATFLPESPTLNYLRGLAASATGDHKAAHELLLRALDTKDEVLEQRVKAALGLAYAREALSIERTGAAAANTDPANAPDMAPSATPAKSTAPTSALETWKLAVGFLEDALVMDPNDLESRRSLEVALLRVDPPCSTRDDELEDNDSRETMKALAFDEPEASQPNPNDPNAPDPTAAPADGKPKDVSRARKQLFSCPDDDDWFALELDGGDRVELAATLPKEAGRLAFTVFAPDGTQAFELQPSGERLRFVVPAERAGRWAILVKNVDLDEVSYGLEAVVRPACAKTEDHLEDNDSPLSAKMITPGPVPDLKSCPGDEDWYALVLAEGESLFLYAQPEPPSEDEDQKKNEKNEKKDEHKAPALELEILDETGNVRATGAPTGLARVSTLLTPGPGRYLIRVRSAATGFGTDGKEPFEGRYALQAEVVPPCPDGDDRFEDNDIPESATDFAQASAPPEGQGQGQPGNPQNPDDPGDPAGGMMPMPPQPQQGGPPVIFARVCPGDSDWWSFTSTGEKPEMITATFDHDKGDLDLVLYDETGTREQSRSEVSASAQNGEVVALPLDEALLAQRAAKKKDPQAKTTEPELSPTPKTWKLLVRGKGEGENFYLLRLDQPSGGGGDSGESDDSQDQENPEDQEDKKDQDQQDQKDQKDQSDKQDPQKPQEQNPLQEALDKLDKNPENLPARDAANRSPLANQKPLKDW